MVKLKTVLATGVLVAVLALTSACGGNNDVTPTPVPTTPKPVPTTPAPTTVVPQSKYGVPKISKDYPDVVYEHGDVFWRKDISGGIEQAVMASIGKLKAPEDLKCVGAIVDEKYEQVVAWGNVNTGVITPISKVSFLDIKSGFEISNSWFGANSIRDVAFAYGVNGKDYVILAGSTAELSIWKILRKKVPKATNPAPYIEVRERTEHGSIAIGHLHPVAILEGEAYGVTYDNASGKLNFKTTSSTGSHNISLDRILSLENERPLFE